MDLRIAQLRKQKEITQKRLAEICLTTQQQIAKIENGNVDPQLSTLRRLADALGCEIGDLFYSKAEFLRDVESAARDAKLNLKISSILDLNSACARFRNIHALHPYWELVEIKNGKIKLKEKI